MSCLFSALWISLHHCIWCYCLYCYCRYKSLAEEYQQQLAVFQGQRSNNVGNEPMMLHQGIDSHIHHGSPQLSERSEQLTPRSVGAVPILPMEEVFHSSGDGQSLASGSMALSIGRGVQFMGTPLDQSLNSAIDHAPLGSPLQLASLAASDGGGDSVRGGVMGGVAPPTTVPIQYGLGMLAQSRLSHHSPATGPQVKME